MVVCVRGRQVHAEWGWLAAGGATELDWWLYAASWSPSPPMCLYNGHLGTHQQEHKHWTHIHTGMNTVHQNIALTQFRGYTQA